MKRRVRVIVVVLGVMLFALGIFAGCNLSGKTEPLNEIDLKLDYNVLSNAYDAEQTLTYYNKSGKAVSEIFLYFYPNAFSEQDNLPVAAASVGSAYPKGVSLAQPTIRSIAVSGEESEYFFHEDKSHIIRIPLAKKLGAGKSITLTMSYRVRLPFTTLRFGYNDRGVNLAQFYFQPAVFDGKEWYLYDYYAAGDPFYADMADFKVEINYPAHYTIVSSGSIDRFEQNGNRTTAYIEAPRIRDFALVMSSSANLITQTSGDTLVQYLFVQDKKPADSLKQAVLALETFNRLFGKYDYPTLTVVETDFLHGGMEFGNLIYVTTASEGEEKERIIVHEIAHQWWYGTVGSNQVMSAWVDESLTEFSTILYYYENDRQKDAENLIYASLRNYNNYTVLISNYGQTLNSSMQRALYEFETDLEYTIMVYVKGMLMYQKIYREMGEKAFLAAVQDYYKKYQYKNATESGLIACFEKKHKGIGKVFNSWLQGEVVISGTGLLE